MSYIKYLQHESQSKLFMVLFVCSTTTTADYGLFKSVIISMLTSVITKNEITFHIGLSVKYYVIKLYIITIYG